VWILCDSDQRKQLFTFLNRIHKEKNLRREIEFWLEEMKKLGREGNQNSLPASKESWVNLLHKWRITMIKDKGSFVRKLFYGAGTVSGATAGIAALLDQKTGVWDAILFSVVVLSALVAVGSLCLGVHWELQPPWSRRKHSS
jgi:hypothetical protein